jgi:hypothetical protein
VSGLPQFWQLACRGCASRPVPVVTRLALIVSTTIGSVEALKRKMGRRCERRPRPCLLNAGSVEGNTQELVVRRTEYLEAWLKRNPFHIVAAFCDTCVTDHDQAIVVGELDFDRGHAARLFFGPALEPGRVDEASRHGLPPLMAFASGHFFKSPRLLRPVFPSQEPAVAVVATLLVA